MNNWRQLAAFVLPCELRFRMIEMVMGWNMQIEQRHGKDNMQCAQ